MVDLQKIKGNFMSNLLKKYVIFLGITTLIITLGINVILFLYSNYVAKNELKNLNSKIDIVLSNRLNLLNSFSGRFANSTSDMNELIAYFDRDTSDYLEYNLEQYYKREGVENNSIYTIIDSFYGLDEDLKTIQVELDGYNYIYYSSKENKFGEKIPKYVDNSKYITLSKALRNPITLDTVGIAHFSFSQEELINKLGRGKDGMNINFIIVSPTGRIISSSTDLVEKALKDSSKLMELLGSGKYLYTKSNNRQGYAIVTYIKKIDVFNHVNVLHFIIILSGFISIGILSVLLYKIFSEYQYQIDDILTTLKKIMEGGLDHRINMDRKKGELYVLSQYMNKMIDSVCIYTKNIYELKIKQKDAEMKALQFQINPHFLYNTLEYIRMSAVMEGAEELGDMVYEFSTLLRGNTSAEKTLTLEKEVEFCEKYMYLFKLRYPDKVNYEISIEDEVKNIEMPKFSIQPLVENYFVHGINYLQSENLIRVKASIEKECLLIQIIDNGVGIEKDKLRKINAYLRGEDVYISKSIGIANVHERLKLFFGVKYAMKFNEEMQRGTKIVIRIQNYKL